MIFWENISIKQFVLKFAVLEYDPKFTNNFSNDMKPMMLLPPCSSPGSSQMHHGTLHESPHGFRYLYC